jgi:hypothetical protein
MNKIEELVARLTALADKWDTPHYLSEYDDGVDFRYNPAGERDYITRSQCARQLRDVLKEFSAITKTSEGSS